MRFNHMTTEEKQQYLKDCEEIIIELKKIQKEIYYMIQEKYNYKSPLVPAIVENAIMLKRKHLEKVLAEDKLEIEGEKMNDEI